MPGPSSSPSGTTAAPSYSSGLPTDSGTSTAVPAAPTGAATTSPTNVPFGATPNPYGFGQGMSGFYGYAPSWMQGFQSAYGMPGFYGGNWWQPNQPGMMSIQGGGSPTYFPGGNPFGLPTAQVPVGQGGEGPLNGIPANPLRGLPPQNYGAGGLMGGIGTPPPGSPDNPFGGQGNLGLPPSAFIPTAQGTDPTQGMSTGPVPWAQALASGQFLAPNLNPGGVPMPSAQQMQGMTPDEINAVMQLQQSVNGISPQTFAWMMQLGQPSWGYQGPAQYRSY